MTHQNHELPEIDTSLGTYIDPLTDFGFKRLFGQEESKEFLISFLNSLLQQYGAPEISDLTYRNTEVLGTIELDRKAVYDIYCTTTQGTNFVVELQKGYQEYYKNRSLCYGCRAITDQMKKGADYKFDLNNVFVVSILNFTIPEYNHKPADKYLHSVSLRDDDDTEEIAFDNLKFISIELPKFNKETTESSSIVDKWIGILKDLAKFNDLVAKNLGYADDFWTRFFHRAKIKNLETIELENYQSSVKYFNEISDVKAAYANLLEQQMEESQEKVEKAEQEKEKAEQKNKITVQNMFKKGFDISEIMEITQLSESEILALQQK